MTSNKPQFDWNKGVGFIYSHPAGDLWLKKAIEFVECTRLSDQELFDLFAPIQKLSDAWQVNPLNATYKRGRIFSPSDFRKFPASYVYKFQSLDTWEKYTSHGFFLASSLGRFREMEGQGDTAGDRFEGMSYGEYQAGKRTVAYATTSGFETWVYSTTANLKNANEMKARFGAVVLKIRIAPFAAALAKACQSRDLETRYVRYADLKIHRGKISSRYLDEEVTLNPGLAKELRKQSRLPSIFGKPSRFAEENEVRVAVRTKGNLAPMLSVTLPEWKKWIDRIA